MKELIKHLFENNYEQIAARSLKNCHTMGLNSIMLLESPEKTIRLYTTDYTHGLDTNRAPFGANQTIAFHPHHCNLTLHCIKGQLINYSAVFMDTPVNTGFDTFKKYRYMSKINDGDMAFTECGRGTMISMKETILSANESLTMPANEIHTVWCPRSSVSAWLVYEGKEDPKYEPICYTKANPNTQVSNKLYQPIPIHEAFEIVKNVGLL